MIFQLMQDFPETHAVGIEEVAYQKALRFFAEEEMRRTSRFIPFAQLKTDTRIKKEMRIRGLVPRFSNKTVYLKRGASNDLEDELFERVKNDDLKDALAYQLQIANIVPSVQADQILDPFNIDSVLIELIKKNTQVGKTLEANLSNYFRDTQPSWGQLKEN
jgi:hypothetical protein